MRIHKPSDDGFLRAAVVLLFLAVCAWTGAALYRTLRLHPASGEALQAAVAEGIPLTGVAIRREQLLCSRGGATLAAEAGKRVARGAVLAVAADGSAVYAERSAVFFPDWDGLEALGPRFPSESRAGGSSGTVSHSKVVDQLSSHHEGYIPYLSKQTGLQCEFLESHISNLESFSGVMITFPASDLIREYGLGLNTLRP